MPRDGYDNEVISVPSGCFGDWQGTVMLRKNNWRPGRIGLLLLVILVLALAASGCVKGLQPIGWSGGALSDGTLYVGSREGRLVSVNTADESRLWAEPLKASGQSGGLFGCTQQMYGGGCGQAAGVAIYGTPAVAGDLVCIGGYNGKVYAYTNAMSVRWVYPREDYLDSIVGGLVAADGRLHFGCSDGKVYALDAATGDKLWEFATGDKVWATPAVSGGVLYIGSFDEKLYALNAATGEKLWEYAAMGPVIATPLVHDGTVYFGSFDKNLYALNAANGSVKWTFTGESWFWARPAVYGDNIYAGCLDGYVYILRAATGALVTSLDMGSPVSSNPVISDGSVIFASREGSVYSINTASNELRYLAEVDEEVYGPLTIYQGVVYIHTQDLTLHRVNAESGAVLRPISLESPD